MNRTVLLVDDNDAFRGSTAWLLGGLGYEVREFASADALLAGLAELAASPAPFCVLTDVRMPGTDGLRLHDALIARGSRWPVIYMTGHGDVPLAVAAMRKGALSFLEKPFRESALEEALEEAFESSGPGGATRPESAVEPAAPVAPATPEASLRTVVASARLTARECQVLELVMQGCLNKTIADRLDISIKTVELHRANMMRKVGARSIADLMRRVLTAKGPAT